jgi:hypothetical protein
MKDYIINSFILQDKNTLEDLYNYIKFRYNNEIEINEIKQKLTKLIKNNIIFLHNKNYELSEEGKVILNDHKYYYSRIIYNFYKKYSKNSKKYELREIRKEQQKLREYLICNKKQICIICDKKLPLCLLETAHLKPRCILNKNEINDINIVEFMCRYCHNLYDNGFLSVYNGILQISEFINKYDLEYAENKQIDYYNLQNDKYFMFHYKYIFKNSNL